MPVLKCTMKTIYITSLQLKATLYTRLALRGITDVLITWNDDILRKIELMEPGPEKEAAIDEAVDMISKIFVDIEEGHFVKKPLPLFNDSLNKKAQDLIHNVSLNRIYGWTDEKKAQLKVVLERYKQKVSK